MSKPTDFPVLIRCPFCLTVKRPGTTLIQELGFNTLFCKVCSASARRSPRNNNVWLWYFKESELERMLQDEK